METKTKVTPELCYQAAVNAAGKILVDELATQLGIKRAKFLANIMEHCVKNRVATPDIKLDDSAERAIKRLPKVFERGNVKQAVSLTASRVEAMGLGSYLRFESKPVPAGSYQIDGVMVDVPLGAILVYPNMDAVEVVTPEANAEEVKPQLVDVTEEVAEILAGPSASGAHAREVMETPENPLMAAVAAGNPELEKSDGIPVDDQGNAVETDEFDLDGESETVPVPEEEPVSVPSISALTEALSKVTA